MAESPGLPPLAPLGSPEPPKPARAAAQAAEEFEAVFLAQMLQGLFQGLRGEGPLGGDNEVFTQMLHDEYARLISRAGGIGVADAVLREMLKLQEMA